MLNLSRKYSSIILLLVCIGIFAVAAKESEDNGNDKPAWTKKKLADYSDADMERLLDQWNVRTIFKTQRIRRKANQQFLVLNFIMMINRFIGER